LDNLTHTLVGVLVGETAARTVPLAPAGLAGDARRNLFVWVAGVASNLPDADFLYVAARGDKLGYLLQHRGYTHTIVGAVIAALLVLLVCEAWMRWRGVQAARADRVGLFALALLALLLHIGMDFTNSYGVHPFWPLYDGWLYGDSVFIVEPWIWAAAAPLVFLLRSWTARILVAVALIAGNMLCLESALVPRPLGWVMLILTAAMLLIGRYLPARTALCAGIGAWLAVTGVFAASGRAAASQVEHYAATALPRTVLLDHVLTPMPADPVCWEVLLIGVDADQYRVQRAMLSLVPGLIPAARCPTRSFAAPTIVPLDVVPASSAAALRWYGEFAMPRGGLAKLAAADCEAAALLRFARAPWAALDVGQWLIGDLRFAGGRGLGFADLRLNTPESVCPAHVPPWLPPRRDLLAPGPAMH
jgi:inner membrane protein